ERDTEEIGQGRRSRHSLIVEGARANGVGRNAVRWFRTVAEVARVQAPADVQAPRSLATSATSRSSVEFERIARTIAGETNARLPISITRPKVIMPRKQAMPKCSGIARASTMGRVSRGQISAAYESSQ